MKHIIYIILLIFLLISPSKLVLALEKGDRCPEFKVKSSDNTEINDKNIKGKVVYLDFWAAWCPPCKKSIPWMNEIQNKYEKKGFQVIAINLDTKHIDAEKILNANKPISIKVGFDAEGISPQIFEINTMPTSFLIDSDGMILEVYSGYSESEKEEIIRKIEEAIKDNSL